MTTTGTKVELEETPTITTTKATVPGTAMEIRTRTSPETAPGRTMDSKLQMTPPTTGIVRTITKMTGTTTLEETSLIRTTKHKLQHRNTAALTPLTISRAPMAGWVAVIKPKRNQTICSAVPSNPMALPRYQARANLALFMALMAPTIASVPRPLTSTTKPKPRKSHPMMSPRLSLNRQAQRIKFSRVKATCIFISVPRPNTSTPQTSHTLDSCSSTALEVSQHLVSTTAIVTICEN